MKKVVALIRPSSLGVVVDALDRLDVGGVTVSDVAPSGHDPLRGSHRGAHQLVDTIHGLRVEVVSTDSYAGPIAWAIATAARTGRPGDGIVFVETVEQARRIRTGEQGVGAVSARLDAADTAEAAIALRQSAATPDRAGVSDWTKVLVSNVMLSTFFVVVALHAPVGYAAVGAGSAGLFLWARERWLRRTR